MISVSLAQELRAAGLNWRPVERDCFALPGHDLDGQVFVVNPLPALVQQHQGQPMVTFHGSVEWALDYILLSEVLWLPSESQLRMEIEARLLPGAALRLERTVSGYECTITLNGGPAGFSGPDPETAYGLALRALLTM